MRIMAIVMVFVTALTSNTYGHPESEINKIDATGCHLTLGGGGAKHYHTDEEFFIEEPCAPPVEQQQVQVESGTTAGDVVLGILAGVGTVFIVLVIVAAVVATQTDYLDNL